MSIRSSLVLVVSIGLCFQLFAQSEQELEMLKKDVGDLASDKMKGREAGTKHELAAAKFIAKRFEEMGIAPGGKDSYYQDFQFKVAGAFENKEGSPDSTLKNSRNVIAYIDNGGRNTIVIGAHYDHLGMGGNESRHTGKKKVVHNGADDNASGTAAMLLLAKKLKAKKDAFNNYLFIAFSAEEQGIFGSKYYVNHPTISLSKINCMFNLDMVGRLGTKNELILTGIGTSPKWRSILAKVALPGVKIIEDESGLGRSDHTPFYLKEIPVLNFFTGKHEDYHKPSDDVDKIDFDGILKIVNYAENVLEEVDKVLKMAYSQTEDPSKRKDWEKPRSQAKYKVTLGVMPDYAFDGNGMRIEAVIGGRPAAKAGMQDGDIVTRMGDVEVTDMQTYMKALSQFNEGEKTIVQFEREGQQMEAEVEF